MMRLDGRTALVTGGTQGVGAAIARSLASAGCDLVLHGLHENAESDETLALCRAEGVKTATVFADLSEVTPTLVAQFLADVDQAAANISAAGVSLLINNAGTYNEPNFLEIDLETFSKTMQLNVYAGFFLSQAYARRWSSAGVAGRILFTGSINGILSEPEHAAYDISKGAVHAMVRTLCVSLAPLGIRVNGMAPGLVVTPLTGQVLQKDPDVMEWMKLHTPNGRVPGPESCGATALFLLSDLAEHIQGQVVFVDGGMSAWQQPDLPAKFRMSGKVDGKPNP